MDPSATLNGTNPAAGRRRVALAVVVVAWGVAAIVTQSLLLREALVLMFGSELAWGIVLFAWLLGVAVGAAGGGWTAGRLTTRRTELALAVVLTALSLVACAELWVFRGARSWLGVDPGAVLPLFQTAVAALLFVPPAGALVGAAFPLACSLAERARTVSLADDAGELQPFVGGDSARAKARGSGDSGRVETRGSLGSVYALEAAGSLIGGAAFSFWAVEHLSPIETALACGAVTTAASGMYLAVGSRRPLAAAPFLSLALVGMATLIVFGKSLDESLVERRWRNVALGYTLCAEIETKYQSLAVGRRARQYTLYSDGQVTVDFPDIYTFAPLAHLWMCQHPAPNNVLMLGGGAEGLLLEILRHPVKHVDYVEPDPKQIELIAPYLTPDDRRALFDPRVTVHNLDARYYVKTQESRFDLVIARLPEPTSALRARFYTEEFFGELRRAMKPRAVLCMTATATPANLTAAAAEYLASILATLHRHFPQTIVGWGNPAHVIAATDNGLATTDAAILAKRYRERDVQSEMFDPLWFDGATDWFEPDKVRQRAAEIERVTTAAVSTDLRPFIYMQRLALWERMTGGPSAGLIDRLRSVGMGDISIALAAIGAATLIGCRLRYGPGQRARGRRGPSWIANGAVILSVATTGFATMALSIIWLFSFQSLYGYVYQRIGWIIAVFMAGLVVGCGAVARRLHRGGESTIGPAALWKWLIATDTLLALLALTVPFILPALGELQSTHAAFVLVEWAISIMVALTGVLGGATFALAGALWPGLASKTLFPGASGSASGGRSTGEPTLGRRARRGSVAGGAAGVVVGVDHAGASLGALLTGILLVPVFGTAAAAFLLVVMKVASAGLLVWVWRSELLGPSSPKGANGWVRGVNGPRPEG